MYMYVACTEKLCTESKHLHNILSSDSCRSLGHHDSLVRLLLLHYRLVRGRRVALLGIALGRGLAIALGRRLAIALVRGLTITCRERLHNYS